MERFLFRLCVSKHADKFVLKGALMLAAWGTAATRPTRDIDLLGYLPNRVDELVSVIREVCSQDVEPDALLFNADTVTGRIIKEDADYEVVRVTFQGSLQNMRMQIDVGFGDTVFPAPTMIDYPTILNQAVPHLRGYSRETTVAEKFEAMVKLGLFNSRMKDFYDIWLLSRQFAFDGQLLATALERTFAHRGTPMTAEPTAFSKAFATDASKVTQWRGFLSRSRLQNGPGELAKVTAVIAGFLSPPALAIQAGHSFPQAWPAGGPWTTPLT